MIPIWETRYFSLDVCAGAAGMDGLSDDHQQEGISSSIFCMIDCDFYSNSE